MSPRRRLGGSTPYEREVRLALEKLLPTNLWIKKASKYTESEEIFKGEERLKESPPDYVICNKDCGRELCQDNNGNRLCNEVNLVAVIEVKTRKPLLNYNQLISDNNLPELLREQGVQGYLILVVKAEDPSKPKRYAWTTPQVIQSCDKVWEERGELYKEKMWVYRVPPKKWNEGLQTLVKELLKIAEGS